MKTGSPEPDQVTIQAAETQEPGSAAPVDDIVLNETPQVTAPTDAQAQDNTRIQWTYPDDPASPPDSEAEP